MFSFLSSFWQCMDSLVAQCTTRLNITIVLSPFSYAGSWAVMKMGSAFLMACFVAFHLIRKSEKTSHYSLHTPAVYADKQTCAVFPFIWFPVFSSKCYMWVMTAWTDICAKHPGRLKLWNHWRWLQHPVVVVHCLNAEDGHCRGSSLTALQKGLSVAQSCIL